MHQQKGFSAHFYHEGVKIYVGHCPTKEDAIKLAESKKIEFLKNPDNRRFKKKEPRIKSNLGRIWQHFKCSDEMRVRNKSKLSDFARPEVSVRLAVLEQALVDIKQVSSWVASANQIQKNAFEWITQPDYGLPSFTFNSIVEDILGVDPEDARKAILKDYVEYQERQWRQ
tara:strand:- start:248 stop:757 length:510 start_codon:yes stop_codon:yes gene_type:complete